MSSTKQFNSLKMELMYDTPSANHILGFLRTSTALIFTEDCTGLGQQLIYSNTAAQIQARQLTPPCRTDTGEHGIHAFLKEYLRPDMTAVSSFFLAIYRDCG